MLSRERIDLNKGSLTRYAGFGISEKANATIQTVFRIALTALFLLAAAGRGARPATARSTAYRAPAQHSVA